MSSSRTESEAWRSVDVIRDNEGGPHVLQQRVAVYGTGHTEASAGSTKPTLEHRLVLLTELTTSDTG